jgi:hypothetical protein
MTKDEALKKAIWMLETIDKGERVYETRMIAETIHECQEALESNDSDYVFVCKHCGDELGIKWADDVVGQITINPK